MTQSEAAAMIGKSRQYINELLRDGKIKRHGKKVDFDELLLYRRDNSDPARDEVREWNGGKGKPRGTKKDGTTIDKTIDKIDDPETGKKRQPTYAEAKTFRETYMAQLAKLTYDERKGDLISKERVLALIEVAFTEIKSSLNDLPHSIKSHFPDTPMEIIMFVDGAINKIKIGLTEKDI
jgi:hypothetical protein